MTVKRGPGNGWLLTLVTKAGERAGERRLAGSDCAELMHAAALVLALMINPAGERRGATAATVPAAASSAAPATGRTRAALRRRRGRRRRQRRAPRRRARAGAPVCRGRLGAVRRAAGEPVGVAQHREHDRRERGRIVLSGGRVGRGCARARRDWSLSPGACVGVSLVRLHGTGYGVTTGHGVRLVDRGARRGEPAPRISAGERGAACRAAGGSAGEPEFRACRAGSCIPTGGNLVTWNTWSGATLLAMGKGPPGHSPTMASGAATASSARAGNDTSSAGELLPTPGPDLTPRQLYDSHFPFVWRNLRRLGVPDVILEDAAQDVFLVVHRRWDSFDSHWSSARPGCSASCCAWRATTGARCAGAPGRFRRRVTSSRSCRRRRRGWPSWSRDVKRWRCSMGCSIRSTRTSARSSCSSTSNSSPCPRRPRLSRST